MPIIERKQNLDIGHVEEILRNENKFITGLFSILSLPNRNDESSDDENVDHDNEKQNVFKLNGKPRAKSLSELQQRLEVFTNKKKLSYKDKMSKKSLKSRLKKKTKRDERNLHQKIIRADTINGKLPKTEKSDENDVLKTAKPVFNSEGKMVFSKFDFTDFGTHKTKKQGKDPKRILENLEKQKEKIHDLEQSGDMDKAIKLKEKTAWKNALAKAGGVKVKDDAILLKRSVKRKELMHRSSKKKWQARENTVEKAKVEKQKKRTENIQKRKKEKKLGKLKKASKRGKVIAGF